MNADIEHLVLGMFYSLSISRIDSPGVGLLARLQQEIHAERDRKLEEARKQRQIHRQQAA